MSHDSHHPVQYEDSGIPQPWHLVRPSVWPFIAAMCAGVMMALGVMYMHKDKIHLGHLQIDLGLKGVVIGFAAVAFVAMLWWKDIIHEAFVEKAHSPAAKKGLHFGMALVHQLRSHVLRRFLLGLFQRGLVPTRCSGRYLATSELSRRQIRSICLSS